MTTIEDINVEHAKAHVNATGMTWLGHHRCGACGSMVGYKFVRLSENMVDGATQDDLDQWDVTGEGDICPAFDSSCDCNSLHGFRLRPWSEFINTFTMQDTPEKQLAMYEKFLAGKPTHEAC